MAADYVLEMKNITKEYGPNVVLQDVSLRVKPGEIHALLGENGAGKSTLMNILFGMPVIHSTGGYKGEVLLDGQTAHVLSPPDAMARGIGMVHQEFMLIPGLSITENIKLNREISHSTVASKVFGQELESLDRPAMAADARVALDKVGMGIEEFTLVKGLPVGYMQFIEIAREIDKTGIKLLVFDEPTAVLTEGEAEKLISVMRTIAGSGIAIIFITHRLDEVMSAADSITILRDGRLAATRQVGETSLIELAQLMIGRGEESMVDRPARKQPLSGKVAMRIRNLVVDMPGERAKGVDLDVLDGEILGVGGLAGQGKIGIPNGVMGLYPAQGEVELFGEKLPTNDPLNALKHSAAMVSEDRRGVGLLLDQSITENIVFSALQTRDSFLRSILPTVKSLRLPKWANILAGVLCAVFLVMAMFGVTQLRTSFDMLAVATKQASSMTYTGDAIEAAPIEGEAVEGEAVEGEAAAAAGTEDLSKLLTGETTVFLSERDPATLTAGERVSLFFASNYILFSVLSAVIGLAWLALYLLSTGKGKVVDQKGANEYANKMIKELDIRCTSAAQHTGTLSGGNQQKVCIARALALNPKFLFVSEPTRGIDIGAKKLVLETLLKLNRELGLTIVMVSSELLELRSICDRIAIVAGGKVADVFPADAGDAEIGLAMSGIKTAKEGEA